jgi:carboxypeptidase C (cathepsin A)
MQKRNLFGAVILAVLLLAIASLSAVAQYGRPTSAPTKPCTVCGGKEICPDIELLAPVSTDHSISIDGQKLDYTATVGYLVQRESNGHPIGYMFYTSYTKKGTANRPLTFVFNGGPGSSSVYLHMLTIGPRMAVLDDEGNTPGPPPTIKDNTHTWLEFSDLVFIDPIGTGFSFPHPGSDPGKYWGADADARSVADFVRMFLTENSRWLSPIFISGESYGGVRGTLLAQELQNNRQIKLNVNGIVFISPAYDWQSLASDKTNPIYLSQYMPTFAATAWHHENMDRSQFADFDTFMTEVQAWSNNEYLTALVKGDRIPEAEKTAVIDRIVRYTGLDRNYVIQQNIRFLYSDYMQDLLAHKGIVVDRLDSRWERGAYELTTTLSPVMNHYVRQELGYNTSKPYVISGNVRPWPYPNRGGAYSVIPMLSQTMQNNRNMKVLVTAGYYDYACPFGTIDYALDQLLLKPELQGNVIRKYYHAGHMVYTPKDELETFTNDVREFYENALK